MTGLAITDCRVRPCALSDARLCAFATITLNAAFVVCDLKVIHGNEGVFVAMPSRRRRDGSFRDVAHPLNAEMRAEIERIVLAEYLRELKRRGQDLPGAPAHVSLESVLAQPPLHSGDTPSASHWESDFDYSFDSGSRPAIPQAPALTKPASGPRPMADDLLDDEPETPHPAAIAAAMRRQAASPTARTLEEDLKA